MKRVLVNLNSIPLPWQDHSRPHPRPSFWPLNTIPDVQVRAWLEIDLAFDWWIWQDLVGRTKHHLVSEAANRDGTRIFIEISLLIIESSHFLGTQRQTKSHNQDSLCLWTGWENPECPICWHPTWSKFQEFQVIGLQRWNLADRNETEMNVPSWAKVGVALWAIWAGDPCPNGVAETHPPSVPDEQTERYHPTRPKPSEEGK